MRLIAVGKDERALFTGLLALALAQSIIVMVPAWAVQQLFDSFGQSHRKASLPVSTLIAIFLGMALLAFAIEIGKRRLAAEMALRHAAGLRVRLFKRQVTGPFDRRSNRGSALLPFVGDLTAARRWVGEGLARGASALVLIPAMLIMISTRLPTLAGALAVVVASSLAISAALVRPLNNAVREVRKRRGILTAFISGRVGAAATIQVSGRAKGEIRKVRTRTNHLSDAERRRAWIAGSTRGVAQLTNSLLVLVTLAVGIRGAAAGTTTPGAIAAILSLVGLMSAGVTDVARAIELWQPAKVAYERIGRILQRQAPPRARSQSKGGSGLHVENLSVEGRLRRTSFAVPQGSIVLVGGPAASGKSALLGAIAQLVPHHGSVQLDGLDLAGLRPERRASLVSFAANDMAIVPGSIGMNLRYGLHRNKQIDIVDYVRNTGLGELISRLPNGLDARLRNDGDLSSSERQALLLVRAIIGHPPLLLLDSIDAHLDDATIAWLAEKLRRYEGIVLMIASRQELVATATHGWTSDRGLEASDPESGPRLAKVLTMERPRR